MRINKNLCVLVLAGLCCLVGLWLCTSIQGSQKTYEVKPYISVPQYRTDAARAIDAYERLMERYMDLTEKNLFMVGTDIRAVAKKLDSFDAKLTQLSAAIARIEKALGIEQSNLSFEKKHQDKLLDEKSLPSTTE